MSERRNTTIGFTMSAVLILLMLGSNARSARSEAMYNVTYLAPFQYSVTRGNPSYLSYITDPALLSAFKAGSFDGYTTGFLNNPNSSYQVTTMNDKGMAIGYYVEHPIGSGIELFVTNGGPPTSPGSHITFIPFLHSSDNWGSVNAINESGAVVGSSFKGSAMFSQNIESGNGFIYQNGVMQNLNNLSIPQIPTGTDLANSVHIGDAVAIDSAGRIIAYGFDSQLGGGYDGLGVFLLTPTNLNVPEPSTLIIFGLVGGSLYFKQNATRSRSGNPINT